MKRSAGWLLTLAAASGCVATEMDGMTRGNLTGGTSPMPKAPNPPMLRGAVGPQGQPVAAVPMVGPHAEGAMMGVGPEILQASAQMPGTGGGIPGMPPGMPGMPGMPPGMPPMPPGIMPAGGMIPTPHSGLPPHAKGGSAPIGAVWANGAQGGGGGGAQAAMPAPRTQIRFVGPAGAKIGWFVMGSQPGPDGKPMLLPHQMDVPGRYNFIQASIYRLKLSDIPGRPGLELYPTIEVVPSNPKTDAFLAHNYVPVDFTEEDFDQVTAGNFITKVVYLPDPQFQSQSVTGPEELSSTRLDPGVDPVAEAYRRGHILLVVRLGGIDLETRNSPPLDAGAGNCPPMAGMPGGAPNGMMGMGNMPQLPPTPPGVSQPMPGGMPGTPPMFAPPSPRLTAPTKAPNGPMVPANPRGLSQADKSNPDVQRTAYTVGPDGQLYPGMVSVGAPPEFPQTATHLPVETKPVKRGVLGFTK